MDKIVSHETPLIDVHNYSIDNWSIYNKKHMEKLKVILSLIA